MYSTWCRRLLSSRVRPHSTGKPSRLKTRRSELQGRKPTGNARPQITDKPGRFNSVQGRSTRNARPQWNEKPGGFNSEVQGRVQNARPQWNEKPGGFNSEVQGRVRNARPQWNEKPGGFNSEVQGRVRNARPQWNEKPGGFNSELKGRATARVQSARPQLTGKPARLNAADSELQGRPHTINPTANVRNVRSQSKGRPSRFSSELQGRSFKPRTITPATNMNNARPQLREKRTKPTAQSSELQDGSIERSVNKKVRIARPRLTGRLALKLKAQNAELQRKSTKGIDTLTIKPTAKHPALEGNLPEGFSELRLKNDVVSALAGIGITRPTLIQMLAIPKILRGRNVLCASETGSGKTLAYLAPLINRLREEEEHHGLVTRLKRPRALILLPSRDLAAQVLDVAKSLCHVARFRAVGLIRGTKRKFIKEALEKPFDVAIATPDSLLRFRREERILLTDISHLVIDEADTLFDHSFVEATTSIIKAIKIRDKKPPLPPALAPDAQLTVVGATLSTKMLQKIKLLSPNTKIVSSKHLHQILPHIEQRFYRVRQDQKAERLLFLLRKRPGDVLMVFCNTVPSCDWTARFLQSHDIPVVKLHAGFSPTDRKNLLRDFISGKARVLVCTDIASRGIDSHFVNHVILFDFPNSIADYLHRTGRTGRVGSQTKHCTASSFMSHRRDIRMALQIKDASERRIAIMNRSVSDKLQVLQSATA